MRIEIGPRFWITLILGVFGCLLIAYVFFWGPDPVTAPAGSAPQAIEDVVHLAAEGMPIDFDVVGNDLDSDGDLDPLSLSIATAPGAGTASVELDGTVVYAPGPEYDGEDTFTYQVCDSGGLCDEAGVVIQDRVVIGSNETVRFAVFGDYGDGEALGSAAVADLVESLRPDFIVTTGDNSYDNPDYEANVGQYYSDFIGDYQGRYGSGSAVNRFFPSLGDHEYSDGGIEAYLDYFTLPGTGVTSSDTSGNERYYDVVMGPVHIFVLNAQPQEPNGSNEFSAQAEWLKTQLSLSTSPWRLVISPVPPFSSGDNHGSDQRMQWPYDVWGADAVFSGDDHIYERIQKDDLTYFVSGLGGRSIYAIGEPVEGSEFRYNTEFGVLMVEACDARLAFSFHTLSKGGVDSHAIGATSCPGDGGASFATNRLPSGSPSISSAP